MVNGIGQGLCLPAHHQRQVGAVLRFQPAGFYRAAVEGQPRVGVATADQVSKGVLIGILYLVISDLQIPGTGEIKVFHSHTQAVDGGYIAGNHDLPQERVQPRKGLGRSQVSREAGRGPYSAGYQQGAVNNRGGKIDGVARPGIGRKSAIYVDRPGEGRRGGDDALFGADAAFNVQLLGRRVGPDPDVIGVVLLQQQVGAVGGAYFVGRRGPAGVRAGRNRAG